MQQYTGILNGLVEPLQALEKEPFAAYEGKMSNLLQNLRGENSSLHLVMEETKYKLNSLQELHLQMQQNLTAQLNRKLVRISEFESKNELLRSTQKEISLQSQNIERLYKKLKRVKELTKNLQPFQKYSSEIFKQKEKRKEKEKEKEEEKQKQSQNQNQSQSQSQSQNQKEKQNQNLKIKLQTTNKNLETINNLKQEQFKNNLLNLKTDNQNAISYQNEHSNNASKYKKEALDQMRRNYEQLKADNEQLKTKKENLKKHLQQFTMQIENISKKKK